MAIKKVFVVGAGLMGGGITQVAATAGYEVTMRDMTDEILEKSVKTIEWSVGKFASKGKITEEQAKAAISNIKTTTELADAADADLVIEAVFEKLELKQEIFKALDEICKPECVLASNTSAISITSIASATSRPELVVGTHFFSPVPMMRLCELVRGLETSDAALGACEEFAKSIGKETVVVNKDVAGFVANRVGLAMSSVAVSLVAAGVATPQDVDKTMRLGFGHAMGPCETADLTGIDVLMNAMKSIYNETKDERYWPPELLQRMAAAGLLGRKTKKGFYDYNSGQQEAYWKL
ncbi:MAG: 3-hydroxybutyryl-CoA dehydrogenase [Candidatus Anoxymicrobium japonicum]|uniref:3-hydroxybutyryl-CoA dehydrogenase n=1 Tax=Candidatus Anoxymicrobium japonicum TaxID=2013648 RepID=A0A2N3G4I3_9ACTN|nr:MAG: 3-hydroxybutyryl-CoA dehydrogenase [Candidatus Anoxymicrobium japonicum]